MSTVRHVLVSSRQNESRPAEIAKALPVAANAFAARCSVKLFDCDVAGSGAIPAMPITIANARPEQQLRWCPDACRLQYPTASNANCCGSIDSASNGDIANAELS